MVLQLKQFYERVPQFYDIVPYSAFRKSVRQNGARMKAKML